MVPWNVALVSKTGLMLGSPGSYWNQVAIILQSDLAVNKLVTTSGYKMSSF